MDEEGELLIHFRRRGEKGGIIRFALAEKRKEIL